MIQYGVIHREERYLERLFGEEYLSCKRTTGVGSEVIALYSLALPVSAALLFLLEPMVGSTRMAVRSLRQVWVLASTM